jgi:putative membrane protein (TIGR04086 family)
MRTSLTERIRRERTRTGLAAVITFFAVLILSNAVFAAVVTAFEMPARARGLFSAIAVAGATLSAAFTLARRRRSGGIFIGIAVSAAVIVMIAIGSLINPGEITALGTFAKSILVVVSALIGGIYGVNAKQKI